MIYLYKNYACIIYYSDIDKLYYGYIMYISDCILFEGKTLFECVISFHDAVNDYIDILARDKA